VYAFSRFSLRGWLVPCFIPIAIMAPVSAPHSEPHLPIPPPKAVAIFGISSLVSL